MHAFIETNNTFGRVGEGGGGLFYDIFLMLHVGKYWNYSRITQRRGKSGDVEDNAPTTFNDSLKGDSIDICSGGEEYESEVGDITTHIYRV